MRKWECTDNLSGIVTLHFNYEYKGGSSPCGSAVYNKTYSANKNFSTEIGFGCLDYDLKITNNYVEDAAGNKSTIYASDGWLSRK